MNIQTILIKPLVSEKSFNGAEKRNEYTFLVAGVATKPQVRVAVEESFGVKVLSVKTSVSKIKTRKRGRFTVIKKAEFKKAVIKLKAGDVIEVFEVEKNESKSKTKSKSKKENKK